MIHPPAAELAWPVAEIAWKNTCRLIPSRYPPVGILDMVAAPEDLEIVFELESWTNDRISNELGILHRLSKSEWITGKPMASVVMSAFCHPRPGGSRFNGPDRGAWYAARHLDTAHAEIIFHRARELQEVGVSETRMQMRLYQADFHAAFHDLRPDTPETAVFHDPHTYAASQALAQALLEAGSNGVTYRSVRHQGGECLACFRPKLVENARACAHFEYHWTGTPQPKIRQLSA